MRDAQKCKTRENAKHAKTRKCEMHENAKITKVTALQQVQYKVLQYGLYVPIET